MRRIFALAVLAAGCAASPPGATPDWTIRLDPSAPPAGRLGPALLGQYDLSGALFHYDQVPGLPDAMKQVGLGDWRVGVGRWEVATRLLPTLSDPAMSCAADLAMMPPAAAAPAGTTDLDLIASRDWYDAAGNYSLTYLNSVLDVAKAFGATPYVDLDSMPRALAANQTPSRVPLANMDACRFTFTNKVCNVRPADSQAFAGAAAGLVARVVEGAHPEAQYWELWNEPELAYAWDPSFETGTGKLDRFFDMAVRTLTALDQYRKSAAGPAAKTLHFGLGSFAYASTAKTVIDAFDANSIPIDFISFHSYYNDPLSIVADIKTVADARASSAHYRDIEIALSEWGPDLMSGLDGHSMDPPLHVATVIALGAALGLDRAHHTIFYDFYPGIDFGMIDNRANPKPLYWGYSLLHRLIGAGADRLAAAGFEDGRLDGGAGAILAARDAAGQVRVLLVNRDSRPRSVDLQLQNRTVAPKQIWIFDDPAQAPRNATPGETLTVPARALVLVEL